MKNISRKRRRHIMRQTARLWHNNILNAWPVFGEGMGETIKCVKFSQPSREVLAAFRALTR